MQNTIFTHFLVSKRLSNVGVGHQISVNTAGSWFQNRTISFEEHWGGYRSKIRCNENFGIVL